MCISDKTEICLFVHIIIIHNIITRTASHTTKYIHQRDSPPVAISGKGTISKSSQYVTVVTDKTQQWHCN